MPADTTVKHFDSSMAGAPALTVASSTSAGQLIVILDACLKDGLGLVTVTSLVVSGGVATATLSGGNPAKVDTVVLVAGATPAELNGEKKVASITSNTVVFDATGISDQTATGTITLKMAPAGWVKAFSGTNLAAYKSGDAGATGGLLRVDDTGATDARVVAYESMTDVNTGTGKAPTDVQQSGGDYITRANTTAGTRKWWVIANARFVYIGIAFHPSFPDAYLVYAFGDFVSRKSGDAYKFSVFALTSSKSTFSPAAADSSPFSSNSAGAANTVASRSYTQLGGSVLLRVFWLQIRTAAGSVASGVINAAHWSYPNGPDNGVDFAEVLLLESAVNMPRGRLPGGYACPQGIGAATFVPDERVTSIATLPGRTLLAKQLGTDGCAFIDITGPWAI